MRSITMSRVLLSGALALGAVGAIGGFTSGMATAEAAPSVSPFSGTYVSAFNPSWGITISDGGRITSSSGSDISGRVRADGSYSFTETERFLVEIGWKRERWVTVHTEYAGDMALDGDGNIVATVDTGGSLYLLRQ